MINKKGDADIFLPMLAIGVFIILSFSIYSFFLKDNSENAMGSLGLIEGSLIKANQEVNEKSFYDEKKVELMLEKSLNEFYKNGGFADATCNANWVFNSQCDPDLKKNFVELFKKNSGYNNVELAEGNIVVSVKEEVKNEISGITYNYSKDSEIKKIFDLNKEIELKDEIKGCLYKDLMTCVTASGVEKEAQSDGSIKFTMENNKKSLFYDNNAFIFTVEKPSTQTIG